MTGQLLDKTKVRRQKVKNDTIGSMGITPYQETVGEEYMNEKQLAHIEKILLAWRQSLMEEVDRTVTHM
ncbi:MAG: RNA polymerase-binding protein DksA, partial [Legionella sp.]